MNNLNPIDRASRLGITLTILGVTWFTLVKFSSFLLTMFSQKIYINSLYSSEHILALVFVTIFLTIFIVGVKYVYFELKTFKDYTDETTFNKAKNMANTSFNDIFTILKVTLALLFFTIMLVFNIEIILNYLNLLWKIIYLIFGICFILLFIIKNTRLKFIENVKNIIIWVKPKFKHFSFLLYISFLIFVLAFSYTTLSVSKGQIIKINFQSNSSLTLDIEVANFNIEKVKIYIFKLEDKTEDSKLLKEIILDRGDFNESSYNVLETSSSLWGEKKNNGNSTTINLNNQQTVLKHNIDIKHYLNEDLNDGKYRIKMLIDSKQYTGSKTLELVNDFLKSADKYTVNKKEFVIEL